MNKFTGDDFKRLNEIIDKLKKDAARLLKSDYDDDTPFITSILIEEINEAIDRVIHDTYSEISLTSSVESMLGDLLRSVINVGSEDIRGISIHEFHNDSIRLNLRFLRKWLTTTLVDGFYIQIVEELKRVLRKKGEQQI